MSKMVLDRPHGKSRLTRTVIEFWESNGYVRCVQCSGEHFSIYHQGACPKETDEIEAG